MKKKKKKERTKSRKKKETRLILVSSGSYDETFRRGGFSGEGRSWEAAAVLGFASRKHTTTGIDSLRESRHATIAFWGRNFIQWLHRGKERESDIGGETREKDGY